MKAFSSRRAGTFQELPVLPLPQNFIHSADLAFIAIQLFLHFIQGDKTWSLSRHYTEMGGLRLSSFRKVSFQVSSFKAELEFQNSFALLRRKSSEITPVLVDFIFKGFHYTISTLSDLPPQPGEMNETWICCHNQVRMAFFVIIGVAGVLHLNMTAYYSNHESLLSLFFCKGLFRHLCLIVLHYTEGKICQGF